MADRLDGRPRELFTSGRNYAHVSIPRADGTVQCVIVWTDLDENGNVRLSSAEGRGWATNLRRAKTATVTLMADGNPFEYVAVTCTLIADTHDGADEHVNLLSKKYIDQDPYPFRQPGEQRITFTLRPERVTYFTRD